MSGALLTKSAYFAERVWHRVSRVVGDLPRSRMAAELAFRRERELHREQLPGPSGDDDLLEALRRDGIVTTTVDRLGLADIVNEAKPLVAELLGMDVSPRLPALHLPPDRLATVPEIFRWGVADRTIDLLERYFEVPIAYHGVYLRRDMAVQALSSSNLWHLDMEDRRVVKVVVYLTDVDDGDGSFQYIDRARSLELRRSLGVTYRLGTDAEMDRLVPEADWCTVSAPAGTVIISDTALLFHRGHRPRQRDRVTLFYDYTTRRPLHRYYCKSALPGPYLRELTAGLGDRAHDAVFWRRRLKEFDPLKHE